MIHAVDTDFVVAIEIRDHVFHQTADKLLTMLLEGGHEIAVAPQTLAEFAHVATDPRRLKEPLTMGDALERAERWWHAREVVRLLPDDGAVSFWLQVMREHRLGRKRILDTMLAALCFSRQIPKIISNNEADFRCFGFLEVVTYRT